MHIFATKDTNKNPFIQLCALFFDFCQSFVIQKRAATKIYYGGRAQSRYQTLSKVCVLLIGDNPRNSL